jgi:regulator of sigma E protease
MFTLIIFIFTLLILILVHEFGHFIVARSCGVKVLRFSFGFGKVLIKLKDKRGTEYTWSALPLGGYVKMLNTKEEPVAPKDLPHAFDKQSLYKRFLIVLAGPVFNFLFAWLCIWTIFMLGRPMLPPIIQQVFPGSPASHAGLLPGDKILSINGEPIQDWLALVKRVQPHPNQPFKLTWLRHQQVHTARLKAGIKDHQGYLGILSQPLDRTKPIQYIYPSVLSAFTNSAYQTAVLIQKTGQLFLQLFTGNLSLSNLNGPIGIAQTASSTAEKGLIDYLAFLSLVSISLGVVNLLPIPMLDGGHLLFYCIEAFLRRPLSDETQETALKLGMGFLFFFMIFAIGNDIHRAVT